MLPHTFNQLTSAKLMIDAKHDNGMVPALTRKALFFSPFQTFLVGLSVLQFLPSFLVPIIFQHQPVRD